MSAATLKPLSAVAPLPLWASCTLPLPCNKIRRSSQGSRHGLCGCSQEHTHNTKVFKYFGVYKLLQEAAYAHEGLAPDRADHRSWKYTTGQPQHEGVGHMTIAASTSLQLAFLTLSLPSAGSTASATATAAGRSVNFLLFRSNFWVQLN